LRIVVFRESVTPTLPLSGRQVALGGAAERRRWPVHSRGLLGAGSVYKFYRRRLSRRPVSTLVERLGLDRSPRSMADILGPEAKRLIERIKFLANSTTRILFVFSTALIILWLSGLEPKTEAIHAYLKSKNSHDIAVHYQKIQRSRARREVIKNASTSTKSKNTSRALKEQAKFKLLVNDKVAAQKKALDIARVPYKLPAGVEVQFAIDLAPLFWMAGSFVFLIYLRTRRNELYRQIAKLITQHSNSSCNLSDIFYDAPFWLAPLPPRGSMASMKESILMLTGWKNDTSQSATLFVILVSLLVIQARVITISYASVHLDNSTSLDTIIPIFSSALLVASVLLILDSLKTDYLVVDERMPAIHLPHYDILNRRRFIVTLFLGTASTVVFSACNSTSLPFSLGARAIPSLSLVNKPRYKRKKNAQKSPLIVQGHQLDIGLYRNLKSSVLHYVDSSGTIPSARSIQPINLRMVSTLSLSPITYLQKVNRNHISYTAEAVALDYISQGHHEKACQTLAAAIQASLFPNTTKRPCFRLYDLLAGLATRHSLTEYSKIAVKLLSDATKHQEKIDSSVPALVNNRLSKWRNPNSRWSKTWRNQSKPIRWHQGSRAIVI